MRYIFYFLITFIVCSSVSAQIDFELVSIDTLDNYERLLVIDSEEELYYTKNWELDTAVKADDSIRVEVPVMLHFSEDSDFTSYKTLNFPLNVGLGWHVTEWRDDDGIHWELLNSKGRKYMTRDEESYDSLQMLQNYSATFEEMPENTNYVLDGVQELSQKSGLTFAKIMAGNLLFETALQDFKPVPLIYSNTEKENLLLVWQASFGEFDNTEGDRHETTSVEKSKSYCATLSDFWGWNFSGFREDTVHKFVSGRYVWKDTTFHQAKNNYQFYLLLDQVMAHPKHVNRAKAISKKAWKKAFSKFSLSLGSKYRSWSVYFRGWEEAWQDRRMKKAEKIGKQDSLYSLKVKRHLGEQGHIMIGGILSDTMQYSIDWVAGQKDSIKAITSKTFEFSSWKNQDYKQGFLFRGESDLMLEPVFKAKSLKDYNSVTQLESNNIFHDIADDFPSFYLYFLIMVILGFAYIIFRA